MNSDRPANRAARLWWGTYREYRATAHCPET
jgi:hypothetical protein